MGLPTFLKRAETDIYEDFDRLEQKLLQLGADLRSEIEAVVVKTTSEVADEALKDFAAAQGNARTMIDNAVSSARKVLPALRQKLTAEIADRQAMIKKIDAQMALLDLPGGSGMTAAPAEAETAPAKAEPAPAPA